VYSGSHLGGHQGKKGGECDNSERIEEEARRMAGPYSEDLREKMVVCYQQGQGGLTQKAVAERFLVSESGFKRVWKRYRETGRVAPGKMGGWVEPKVDKAGGESLRQWLEEHPDLTLAELCERYQQQRGVSISTSAMDRGLKRLKVSRKKNLL
jgi:transposase